ncbi:hypothetical protein LCGC14_0503970 [marine sediment metagenome]|uniref:Glycosyltransferase 2-like domain-containing protein n=1 Tax=marine sediment metagenome TaxID=412755 RepID=A0A0F9SLE8_9ZZZZ
MVTAVTACWDRPDQLEMHLESLSKQTVVPKCIVVDNMSEPENNDRQIKVCEQYNAPYFQPMWKLKRHRLSSCCNIGLKWVDTEFVCFLDPDSIFDNTYIEQCMDLMSRYSNMAMATPQYKIPDWVRTKRLLDYGYDLSNIAIMDSGKKVFINFWLDGQTRCMSTVADPKPILHTFHFDGNVWFRTKFAKQFKIFDSKIIDHQGSRSNAAMVGLVNGASLVIIKDLAGYHIEHDKVFSTVSKSNELKVQRYLDKKWGTTVVPSFNKLILIGG